MGRKKKYINIFGSFTEPFNSMETTKSALMHGTFMLHRTNTAHYSNTV